MKRTAKKINVVIEKTKTGFSAYAEDHDVYTTGKSITELRQSILEALNLMLEDEGNSVSLKDITLEIDLKQFFRHYRVLNARYLAVRIGMNPTLLSQYVQGRKRPSQSQTHKIIAGIQEIGKELTELKLIAS